jgi:hypothetical protein
VLHRSNKNTGAAVPGGGGSRAMRDEAGTQTKTGALTMSRNPKYQLIFLTPFF